MKLTPLDRKALEKLIKRQDLKKYWVAMQLGVDKKTLRRWLNGDTPKIRRMHLDVLEKILKFRNK